MDGGDETPVRLFARTEPCHLMPAEVILPVPEPQAEFAAPGLSPLQAVQAVLQDMPVIDMHHVVRQPDHEDMASVVVPGKILQDLRRDIGQLERRAPFKDQRTGAGQRRAEADGLAVTTALRQDGFRLRADDVARLPQPQQEPALAFIFRQGIDEELHAHPAAVRQATSGLHKACLTAELQLPPDGRSQHGPQGPGVGGVHQTIQQAVRRGRFRELQGEMAVALGQSHRLFQDIHQQHDIIELPQHGWTKMPVTLTDMRLGTSGMCKKLFGHAVPPGASARRGVGSASFPVKKNLPGMPVPRAHGRRIPFFRASTLAQALPLCKKNGG